MNIKAPRLFLLRALARCGPRRDELALRVADRSRARTDHLRRRLEHACRHLLLRLGEREQARHRLLEALRLRRTPEDADDLRGREADEESEDGEEAEDLRREDPARVLGRDRQREEQRGSEQDAGDREDTSKQESSRRAGFWIALTFTRSTATTCGARLLRSCESI